MVYICNDYIRLRDEILNVVIMNVVHYHKLSIYTLLTYKLYNSWQNTISQVDSKVTKNSKTRYWSDNLKWGYQKRFKDGRIIKTSDISSISLSTINPFRYRSYYQDNETGWYYLNSRYYDVETLRFITMDDISYLGASGSVLSYNLFSYCENNPVNNEDSTGNYSKKMLIKESWLFNLASLIGINISDDKLSKTIRQDIFSINLFLIKMTLSVSLGLTSNYKVGITLNYTRDSIGISSSTGLGKGYSISYSYTLKWNKIIRSVSLVYCAFNYGLFVSLNFDFEIRHIATAALAVACVYAPQFSSVLPKLVTKSKTSSVVAIKSIAAITRFAFGL